MTERQAIQDLTKRLNAVLDAGDGSIVSQLASEPVGPRRSELVDALWSLAEEAEMLQRIAEEC